MMTENREGRDAGDIPTPSNKVDNKDPRTLARNPEKENNGPSQLRYHWCAWIASPYSRRCPRWKRTGATCWCNTNCDSAWPWRVQPPLQVDPDAPGWSYDEDGAHPC
jgi:hypothetical protein